ncbi:MAG: type I DNA topoisomerase [bacterium]
MTKHLVIVESPAKAKTIGRFLGDDYDTQASYGHIRDLPESKMGINIAENYEPNYQITKDKQKVVDDLRKKAKKADEVILATDEDREGEAIAWHLAQALELDPKKTKRIVFHEITKQAITKALEEPRNINDDLVNAQQARRILDRLVGYSLSPFLWKKIRKGLSAGRVQSVAVRLIVERDTEIKKFIPVEYWSITAQLSKQKQEAIFLAKLHKIGKENAIVSTGEHSQSIVDEVRSQTYTVTKVAKKEVKRNPAPPFTTSTLQQEASRKLGFGAKKTMLIAQQLYEGIEHGGVSEGLITYMRTDSYNIAETALTTIREYIEETMGKAYLPAKPNVYKTKAKAAQEAHEAIRPTDIKKTPKSLSAFLNKAQLQLYELIWQRTLACQVAQAIMDTVSVDITAGTYMFRVSGSTVKFDGFTRIYQEGKDENPQADDAEDTNQTLPELKEGETLKLHDLLPAQHFTKPPARFTEASLVKALEEHGIGRPSTYAPIMSNIVDRGYVRLENRRFFPEDIGGIVNDLLVQHFPGVVDINFTAKMEDNLDSVADGKADWVTLVDEFYKPFFSLLQTKEIEVKRSDFYEKTEHICEKCGKPMLVKFGQYGKFLACSGFPDCKNTKPLDDEEKETTDMVCDKCGAPMEVKRGRFGKFYGCSKYPECKTIKPLHQPKVIGIPCPKCGGQIEEKRSKRGKVFYGCANYPKCDYASWSEPTNEKCETCGDLKVKGKGGAIICPTCEK